VLKNKSLTFLPFVVFCFISFLAISKYKDYYLKADPNEISRMIYGINPFVESPVIANYIKENSSPSDKIAILGSEPQIYFYADRKSASGFIYTYSLMEIHDYNVKMQQQMISEIEMNKPKFLVICEIPTSWFATPASPKLIFDWFYKYSKDNYEIVGIAELNSQFQTLYKWNNDAKIFKPMGRNNVLVFKRK
jgi:hypothetical protein